MSEKRDMLIVARKPTHPGEVLREEFMADYRMSVAEVARRLSVSRQSINEFGHGSTALEVVRHLAAVLAQLAAQC